MQTQLFFDYLYSDISDCWLNVVVIVPPRKVQSVKSFLLPRDLKEITPYCNGISGEKEEVYFTVAPRRSQSKRKETGKETSVSHITALWCDIDVGRRGTNKSYFTDHNEAYGFLMSELPYKPSILVNSGGGYHAYWKLAEPFRTNVTFEKGEYLGSAKQLVLGWNKFIASRAPYDLDIVALTGILRVPGSQNRKNPNAKLPVTIDHFEMLEYHASDIFEHADLFPVTKEYKDENYSGDIKEIMTRFELPKKPSDASPPYGKFDKLYKHNKRFSASWDEQRNDLADPSPSGYSQSLADIAYNDGWSEQEIVNLVVAWRSKYGYCSNLSRKAWHAGNVHSAMLWSIRAKEIQPIDSSQERAMEMIDSLSNILELKIVRIDRIYPESDHNVYEDPQYQLIFEGRSKKVNLPSTADILSYRKFSFAVASCINKVIPAMSTKQWQVYAQAIMTVAKDVIAPKETSIYDQYYEILMAFINSRLDNEATFDSYCRDRRVVYTKNNKVYFNFQEFHAYVRAFGPPIQNQNLAKIMSTIGCKSGKLKSFKNPKTGKQTTVTWWEVEI